MGSSMPIRLARHARAHQQLLAALKALGVPVQEGALHTCVHNSKDSQHMGGGTTKKLRPRNTSTPRIYSSMGETYTMETRGESLPITSRKETAFTLTVLPP